MSDTKEITNVSGSIWISKKTNQLRFKHKDTNSEWLIPTPVYKAGAGIRRGQVVALGDVKDKGTGPFIVPYNEDSQLFHSWPWPLGIALEPGDSEDMIHVLSKGKLEYNTEKYPEESIDSDFIQSLDLREGDIGHPIFVLPSGELSKTDEDLEALCVGRVLYAPGVGESSNKIIIEFDFSYGESLFTKEKRKELKDDLETKLDGKADKNHTHELKDIKDLTKELAGKANASHSHTIDNIENLSNSLSTINETLGSHQDLISEVQGNLTETNSFLSSLASTTQAQLDEKAALNHTHSIEEIESLTGTINGFQENIDTLREDLDGAKESITALSNEASFESLSQSLQSHIDATDAHAIVEQITTSIENHSQTLHIPEGGEDGQVLKIENGEPAWSTYISVDPTDIDHGHSIENVEGLDEKLNEIDSNVDGKADVNHDHGIEDIDDLSNSLSGKSDTGHNHTINDVAELSTQLESLDATLEGKSDDGHGHTIEDISELGTQLDTINTSLSQKADEGHNHTIEDISGLQSELEGKADEGHGHTIEDISELGTQLDTINTSLSQNTTDIHTHTTDIATLRTDIDANTSAISNEVARATGAESALQTAIDNRYTKSESDGKYVAKDGTKVLSDNNYTSAEKNKLAGLPSSAYSKTETYSKTESDNKYVAKDGTVPLSVIPTELTGKNADTATKLTNARKINGVLFDGSTDITVADSTKAPTNHASTATTYGVSSGSNYGHAKASSTTPEANGTAAVGSEVSTFARGDHVHPLQTSVSGNAGTATKLATARKINGVLFDGSKDITVADSTKAPLASPAFTGTPTAPTPATETNNTQIATTAFVKNQKYAPINNPTFTGTPTAPTPATSTNNTQIATTAFVKNQKYAPINNPTFTGTPTAPTPATSTNNTQIATTAFVKAQLLAVIYPIGCYYTQYPDADSNDDETEFPISQRPQTLFGGVWDEQWANESIFFRTRGTLSDIGRGTKGKQEDAIIAHNHNYNACTISYDDDAPGSGYNYGGNYGTNRKTYNVVDTSKISTTETRPVNRRIKVWKRTG